VPSILTDIYWAGSLLPEILMILFTQSTAVLHKYLNDELKYFVTIFPQGCTEFPENSMFREIPEYSRSVTTLYSHTVISGDTSGYAVSIKNKCLVIVRAGIFTSDGLPDAKLTALKASMFYAQ